MSKQDDALPLPQPRSSKGPTAEELRALSVQKAWLDKYINWKALRRLVYSNTCDAVIGSEIVQDLYHDMLQWAPEELQGLQAPQAYANMAVIHRLSNWRRQFSQTDPLPDDYEDTPDESPSLEQVLETREQVVELLAELPPEWVNPWVLCRYFGYKNAEAAQKLSLTVDAVKKRVLRADNYLQILAAAPPPPSVFNRVRNFIQRKERHHDK
jgi:DNA-directed RNA polymerase specialized sigma24 family protein